MTRTGVFRAAPVAALLAFAAAAAFAHGDEPHDAPSGAAAGAAARDAGPAALEADTARRLPDGSLLVPKPVQRRFGIRHRVAQVGELAASVELNARVVVDPNAGGLVQATQAGRIEAGAAGLPSIGRRVSRGEVLAWLRPATSVLEHASREAQLAELDAQRAIAEKKRARYEQLEGAVPQAAIEAARVEAEALNKRRAAIDAGVSAREPLRAPVSGVISAARAMAGQVVEAKEVLFEVIDPARLAVEALAYDIALAGGVRGAFAALPGGRIELQFTGAGRQLREQALPLMFRVRSASAPLAVGQPLKVVVQTSRSVRGAALPYAALVKTPAGETALWLRDGAERFVLRRVQVAPLDATRVVASSGIESGARVVTEGAALLAQVR